MSCQKCGSERILEVDGKTADSCSQQFGGSERNDYVTPNLNIGGGDYLRFAVCLECGQMQGEWPVENPEWAEESDDDQS